MEREREGGGEGIFLLFENLKSITFYEKNILLMFWVNKHTLLDKLYALFKKKNSDKLILTHRKSATSNQMFIHV